LFKSDSKAMIYKKKATIRIVIGSIRRKLWK